MRILYDPKSIDSFAAAWVYHLKEPSASVAAFHDDDHLEAGDVDCRKKDGIGAWIECYDSFDNGSIVPWPVAYVSDRKSRKLACSDELNAVIDSYPRTIAGWDIMADRMLGRTWGAFDQLRVEGNAILRYKATTA